MPTSCLYSLTDGVVPPQEGNNHPTFFPMGTYRCADGYVNIVGRLKDMVIRGGENVYPREIEEFLHPHPDIDDVQVIGVPDAKYGEEICAWIKLRPGAGPLDAAAVRDFAAGKLAHYKIPRYVHMVDEFPMTVTGKVRKVDMRVESIRLLGL